MKPRPRDNRSSRHEPRPAIADDGKLQLVRLNALAELGVGEADAGIIAADAVKDPTAAANPRQWTKAKQLALAAIRGDLGG